MLKIVKGSSVISNDFIPNELATLEIFQFRRSLIGVNTDRLLSSQIYIIFDFFFSAKPKEART